MHSRARAHTPEAILERHDNLVFGQLFDPYATKSGILDLGEGSKDRRPREAVGG